MEKTIGADAAKLAGLQIDALSKFRAGQLSLDHLEKFLHLTPEAREERFGNRKSPVPIVVETAKPVVITRPTPQFMFLADLGIITVPEGYNHATSLALFKKRHQGSSNKSFWSYDENISDKHFSNSSRVLKSGDKLSVRAFEVNTFDSEECISFIAEQGGVFIGVRGLTLTFDQKHDQLPKGYWYSSFDKKKDFLWKDIYGYYRVPGVRAHDGGAFCFGLGRFGFSWGGRSAILIFGNISI